MFFTKRIEHASYDMPEAKLAAAVIKQAYVDWESSMRSAAKHKKMVKPDPFLSGQWASFDFWCNNADLEPDYVRDTYLKCYNVLKVAVHNGN